MDFNIPYIIIVVKNNLSIKDIIIVGDIHIVVVNKNSDSDITILIVDMDWNYKDFGMDYSLLFKIFKKLFFKIYQK